VQHEEALIRSFVRPERRARLLELLQSPNRRAKLRAGLAHFQDLDIRYAVRVPAAKQGVRDIEAMLRERGAPDTCYVLSESSELDARELPLKSALEQVVGRGMGTFLSCIPGKLGYFESEDIGERYVLHRTV
jgi:hypothetical protein